MEQLNKVDAWHFRQRSWQRGDTVTVNIVITYNDGTVNLTSFPVSKKEVAEMQDTMVEHVKRALTHLVLNHSEIMQAETVGLNVEEKIVLKRVEVRLVLEDNNMVTKVHAVSCVMDTKEEVERVLFQDIDEQDSKGVKVRNADVWE